MRRRRLLMLASAMLLSGASFPTMAESRLYRVVSHRTVADVLLDLEFAITNHNYRITGRNRIGSAITERLDEPFPHAEVIQFCNLEQARRLLEVDSGFIAYMPCQVAVYQTDEQVVVSTWLLPPQPPPADSIVEEINAILRDIVDYAAL